MLPPHIVMWLEERHIGTPDGDPVPALQDGLLLLRALHCHLEHPPEYPSERLERWKMIVSILMDGGIEITDAGLRMALFGDRKTLMSVMQTVYCMYHTAEGLHLQLNLDPEPQVAYPPLTQSLIDRAKSYSELVDRIRLCLQVEYPERSAQEIAGLLLDELTSRLERIVGFGQYEDFLQLVVGQMKSPIHAVSIRACGTFQKLVGVVGPESMLDVLVNARTPKLVQAQDNIVSMLFNDGSSPELLDFLHGTMMELACPDHFRALCESLLIPRLPPDDVVHELTKFTEFAELLSCADLPWIIQYTSERLSEAVSGGLATSAAAAGGAEDGGDPFETMEAALVLFLRLWTEVPDTVEASGEAQRVRDLLMTPDGVQLCCRQVVLSELTSAVFVCPDIYDVLLHALESVMRHSQLRRPLLRSLGRHHATNTALSVVPLIELVSRELHHCHCAIAEGDFVAMMGKHPQLSMMFSDLTSTWLDLLLRLMEAEPFMHTYACAAVSQLTSNMPDDADLVSAIGFLTEDLLTTSEEHTHSTLLLHCVSKLHKAAPPGPAEHLHKTVFMFVQRLLRRFEDERKQKEAEAREKREADAAAKDGDEAAKPKPDGDSDEKKKQPDESKRAPDDDSKPADDDAAKKDAPAAADDDVKKDDSTVAASPSATKSPDGRDSPKDDAASRSSKDDKAKPTTPADDDKDRPASGSEAAKPAAVDDDDKDAADAEKPPATEEDPAVKEREERRRVWISGLQQLCAELFIQFRKVPVVELDPPPTPKAADPDSPARGRPMSAGDDVSAMDDVASDRSDPFAMTSASAAAVEGGLVHAQSFTTESSYAPKRPPVNIKQQSKDTLAKLNERKMGKYMDATYVQPMLKKVFDQVARREFKRMVAARGRISPERKVSASAKQLHDERVAADRKKKTEEEAERIRRRDAAREKRDKEIKDRLKKKQQQTETDKTPASPKYFTDNISRTRHQETEGRKAILSEFQKSFVELYRECREDFKRVDDIDRRNERIRAREEEMREAQKRELLRAKLNDYFEVKHQQEELERRNEWERQMQDEFDRRLRFAKRSDQLKRKLLHWKLDKQEQDRQLEESRKRNTGPRSGGPGKQQPPPGRRLPPLAKTPTPTGSDAGSNTGGGRRAKQEPQRVSTPPPPSHRSSGSLDQQDDASPPRRQSSTDTTTAAAPPQKQESRRSSAAEAPAPAPAAAAPAAKPATPPADEQRPASANAADEQRPASANAADEPAPSSDAGKPAASSRRDSRDAPPPAAAAPDAGSKKEKEEEEEPAASAPGPASDDAPKADEPSASTDDAKADNDDDRPKSPPPVVAVDSTHAERRGDDADANNTSPPRSRDGRRSSAVSALSHSDSQQPPSKSTTAAPTPNDRPLEPSDDASKAAPVSDESSPPPAAEAEERRSVPGSRDSAKPDAAPAAAPSDEVAAPSVASKPGSQDGARPSSSSAAAPAADAPASSGSKPGSRDGAADAPAADSAPLAAADTAAATAGSKPSSRDSSKPPPAEAAADEVPAEEEAPAAADAPSNSSKPGSRHSAKSEPVVDANDAVAAEEAAAVDDSKPAAVAAEEEDKKPADDAAANSKAPSRQATPPDAPPPEDEAAGDAARKMESRDSAKSASGAPPPAAEEEEAAAASPPAAAAEEEVKPADDEVDDSKKPLSADDSKAPAGGPPEEL